MAATTRGAISSGLLHVTGFAAYGDAGQRYPLSPAVPGGRLAGKISELSLFTSIFMMQVLNMERLVHPLINQKLGQKHDIPHADHRQQQQRPGRKQDEHCQISQLQKSHAQHPPEIQKQKQAGVVQLNRPFLLKQYQLWPEKGIDYQKEQHSEQI